MKIEETLERIVRIAAFLGIIIFVTLSIISVTIPSFKQNFIFGKANYGIWQETEDRLGFKSYLGPLKAWWSALDTGANKPLIKIEHGFDWIDILEMSAWASSLTVAQGDRVFRRNIFWDHYLHLRTGEELQAAWVSKESDYLLLQKVKLYEKQKFPLIENSYSLVQKSKEIQDPSLYLTNWFYYGDALFVPGSGWQTFEEKKSDGPQEVYVSRELSEPYYVLYFKKGDVGFLIFSVFSKTPSHLGITRVPEGIRTLDFAVSIDGKFSQTIFVRLLYDKEWEDVPASFIEKQISEIFG